MSTYHVRLTVAGRDITATYSTAEGFVQATAWTLDGTGIDVLPLLRAGDGDITWPDELTEAAVLADAAFWADGEPGEAGQPIDHHAADRLADGYVNRRLELALS